MLLPLWKIYVATAEVLVPRCMALAATRTNKKAKLRSIADNRMLIYTTILPVIRKHNVGCNGAASSEQTELCQQA